MALEQHTSPPTLLTNIGLGCKSFFLEKRSSLSLTRLVFKLKFWTWRSSFDRKKHSSLSLEYVKYKVEYTIFRRGCEAKTPFP